MTKRKTIGLYIAAILFIVSFAFGMRFMQNNITASAAVDTIGVSQEGARVAYGPGWGEEAAEKVKDAFNGKLTSLNASAHGNVEIQKGVSDGDALVFGMTCTVGGEEYYLVYNVLNDEVYAVPDRFVSLFKQEVRRIGAPVSGESAGITVTGTDGENNVVNVQNATLQVFETGMIILENDSPVKHEGVVEKISDTEYRIHPIVKDQDILRDNFTFIGDVDGTWHALRTARASREDGKLAVEFNYRAGCIKVVYNNDYSLVSRMAYAGQNFAYDAEGNSFRVNLPYENFTTDEHLWENNEDGVDSSALAMYRSLSKNGSATKDDVKEAFRTGYMQLLADGVIPGYRCSWIKVWDVLCVDYKYSPDSMYGFDSVGSAARERMFTLVYSGVQNKVYGVGDAFWNAWRDDSVRRALGAPISNELTDITISGTHFESIQIFEQGYIYRSEGGKVTVEYGITTDNGYQNFSYIAAPPEKPEQYGTETERFETTEEGRKVVYINYEKGAVKATEMNAKVGYLYDYFPGRNFEENSGTYTEKMLSYEKLYQSDEFTCTSSYSDIFYDHFDSDGEYVAGAKTQMIELIQSLLNQGFFPGFLEGTFEAWNGAVTQQFIFGDSTAQPWGGDSRTNVCAMVYNEKKDKIFLLKDAFMELWGGTKSGYLALGAPAGDEFTLEGYENVRFQYFYGTATQNNLAFAVSVGYNEATYYTPSNTLAERVNPAQYLKDFEELSKPLSGVKIVEPESLTVAVGSYEFIEYVIDGAAADAKVTITSSNDSVAAVMADGSVEFYKTGKVTITVTVSDGVNTFADTVTFNVVKGNGRSTAAGTLGGGSGGNGILIGSLCGTGAVLVLGAAVMIMTVRKKRAR